MPTGNTNFLNQYRQAENGYQSNSSLLLYKLTSAGIGSPLTIAEIKAHLYMDTLDTSQDTYLMMLLAGAVGCFEKITRRTLIISTFTTYRDNWLSQFELRKSRLQAITSVKYYDTSGVLQTVSSSNYYIVQDESYGYVKFDETVFTFPETRDRPQQIEIIFTAGLATGNVPPAATNDTPADIKLALLQHIAFAYENKGDCAETSIIPPQALNTYLQYKIQEI